MIVVSHQPPPQQRKQEEEPEASMGEEETEQQIQLQKLQVQQATAGVHQIHEIDHQIHPQDHEHLLNNPLPLPPDPTSNSTSNTSFRPRKVPKLTKQEGPNKKEALVGEKNDQSKNLVMKQQPTRRTPLSPPLIGRALSCEGEVVKSIRHLRNADPHLSLVIDLHDPPAFHNLHPPFHSLARSILYQQLAFKAAASIYSRFLSLCGGEEGVVPEVVLSLSHHQLRQIGVSARKTTYLHDLASKYTRGILSDESIVAMDDKSLFSMLTMVKGIGAWSVHMFMIFSLHRPDVLPVGDLGVRKGVQLLYGLEELPRPSQMEQLCQRWRPYRSVASWYMWRLVEAKGTPMAVTGAAGQQQQQEQQPQVLDPVNALSNMG